MYIICVSRIFDTFVGCFSCTITDMIVKEAYAYVRKYKFLFIDINCVLYCSFSRER